MQLKQAQYQNIFKMTHSEALSMIIHFKQNFYKFGTLLKVIRKKSLFKNFENQVETTLLSEQGCRIVSL